MNIVFDLGGVVFHWDFESVIDSVYNDALTRNIIIDKVFHHNDWIELDRGTLPLNEAIGSAVIRTGLPEKNISKLMNKIPKSLLPNTETLDLIKKIKNKNDHKLFVLSNMHIPCIEYIDKQFSFWDLFDDRVISCWVRMVKPELDIYKYMLNKFSINASETIFIDDREENLFPARKLGIHTIKFITPKQCKTELTKLNIF